MTSSTQILRDQIATVVAARESVTRLGAIMTEAHRQFEEQHAALLAGLAEAKTTLGAEEQRLRHLTIVHYEETGEAKPLPGVSVRRVTELTYEEQEALTWAREKGLALALDRKAFEKVAKAALLPFVRITEVAQATIARELTVDAPSASEVAA